MLKSKFADEQLPKTLDRALEHPFYKARCVDLDAARTAISEDPYAALERFSPTSKADLRSELIPILDQDDTIAVIGHTSGSTGPIAFRFRSAKEVALVGALYHGVQQGPAPISLGLANIYHGTAFPLPMRGITFPGGGTEEILLLHAIQLLRTEFQIPGYDSRIRLLSGPVQHLRSLTQYLVERDFSPGDTAVSRLATFGGNCTSGIREHLTAYWGCGLEDRWSCSEVFGGARFCPECRMLQFDAHIVAECLDAENGERLSEGIGLLALTELLPFGLTQPLVRYVCGDLVRVGTQGCPDHPSGISFVGRRSSSAVTRSQGRTHVLVGARDFYEALEHPGVERSVKFPQLPIQDQWSIGNPLGALEQEGEAVSVRFLPRTPALRSTADEIRSSLLARSPALAEGVSAGTISLRVLPDDTLHGPSVQIDP